MQSPDPPYLKPAEGSRDTEAEKTSDALPFIEEMAGFGSFTLTLSSVYLAASAVARDVFGVAAHERISARSLLRRIHARDRKALWQWHRRVLAGHLDSIELRFAHTTRGERVLLSTARPLRNARREVVGLHGVCRDVTEERAKERIAARTNKLLTGLVDAQRAFFGESTEHQRFQHLLALLLAQTESSFGFIGEILLDEHGAPYLQTGAITDLPWSDGSRDLYPRPENGRMAFRNPNTLFGEVWRRREIVIANSPDKDARAGGIPAGHPKLRSFLGIPLSSGDDMVGMVGVANRPGGYDEELVRWLAPVLAESAAVISGIRTARARARAERDLAEKTFSLEEAQELARLGSLQIDSRGNSRASPMLAHLLDMDIETQISSLEQIDQYLHASAQIAWHRFARRASTPSASKIYEDEFRSARERLLAVRVLRLQDEKGSSFRCTFQDVTERREMESALRASEQRRARLWERLTAVQDEERRRISRELHDHAGSSLAAILLRCRALELSATDESSRNSVQELSLQLDRCLGDLARLARGLHPSAIDELGLGPALRQLAHSTLSAAAIESEVDLQIDEDGVSNPVKLALYRAAQEALTNILKHSQATYVSMFCVTDGLLATLEIEDNGRGLQTELTERPSFSNTGLGLVGMRERVELLGGVVYIDSQPGKGVKVVTRLPLGPVR
jgi:signal transduction histidine kinase